MEQYRIKLYNRDGAKLFLVSDDEINWKFEVDKDHEFVLQYMRVGYDDEKISFVDPSGGPFLRVHCPIDTYNYPENITYIIEDIDIVDKKFSFTISQCKK